MTSPLLRARIGILKPNCWIKEAHTIDSVVIFPRVTRVRDQARD